MNLLNDHQTTAPLIPPIAPLTPVPAKTEGPTKIAVMPEPDRFAILENKNAELRGRLRWHMAAWWVIFILLLASWFAFGALILSQTDNVRSDAQRDTSHLNDKMNEATAFTQSRIDSRAESLNTRVDQLLRDNILLHSELSALAAKYAAQEGMCRTDCTQDK